MEPTNSASNTALSRRHLSVEDWTKMKPLIHQLYIDKDLSLIETIRVMEKSHDFHATYGMINILRASADN